MVDPLDSEPILAAIDEAIYDEHDIDHESVDPDHEPEQLDESSA